MRGQTLEAELPVKAVWVDGLSGVGAAHRNGADLALCRHHGEKGEHYFIITSGKAQKAHCRKALRLAIERASMTVCGDCSRKLTVRSIELHCDMQCTARPPESLEHLFGEAKGAAETAGEKGKASRPALRTYRTASGSSVGQTQTAT